MAFQLPPDPHYPAMRFSSRPGYFLSVVPLGGGRGRIISANAINIETFW